MKAPPYIVLTKSYEHTTSASESTMQLMFNEPLMFTLCQ